MKILIINAGSSSLKYQFMESEGGQVFAKGLCERIGIDGRLTHKVPGREDVVREIPMPTHSEAIQSVLDIMVDPVNGVIASTDEIAAVGHGCSTAAWPSLRAASSTTRASPPSRSAFPWAPSTTPPTSWASGPARPSCQHPPGGRVRHRFPHDHAPQGLHLRHPLRVL